MVDEWHDGEGHACNADHTQALLEARLRAVDIAFRGEEELRAEGQAKTPDVKLEVPIAVHGRLVHWMDSKASFCDDWTYKTKGLEQFQGCVSHPGVTG
jgi:hypothetical protein